MLVQTVEASEINVSQQSVILTSDFIPPFVYRNDEGVISGTNVAKLKSIFERTDINIKFQYHPWNRALAETKKHSNTLMYPISRIPEREDHYQWIIPLHTLNYNIYGVKGSFNAETIDLTSGEYTFVCQKTTILCTVLESFGIPEKSIAYRSSVEIEQVALMLSRGRIDFMVASEATIGAYIDRIGIDKSQIVIVKGYNYPVVEYLVGNKKTDKTLINKIRLAAEQITSSH